MTDDRVFEHRNAPHSRITALASNANALLDRASSDRRLVLVGVCAEKEGGSHMPQPPRRMRSIGWQPYLVGSS